MFKKKKNDEVEAVVNKEENNSTKEKKLKPWMIIVPIVAVVIIGACVGFFVYENSLVWKTCYVEAGVDVSPKDFMKDPQMEASFSEDTVVPDTTIPGSYELKINAAYLNHKTTLVVQDTIAPVAEVQPISITVGDECSADDFVLYLEDATAVDVSFEEAPDVNSCGEQKLTIVFTDAGNNELKLDTSLFVSQVVPELVLEVGASVPTLQDFVVGGGSSSFVTNIENVDYKKPQKMNVYINVDGIKYESEMIIKDTVPPVVTFKNVDSFTTVTRHAEDFVASAEDVTHLKYAFENAPDLNKEGTQDLVVIVTDEGGNTVSGDVKLTLQKDTEPPVISGVQDITVFVNSTIKYMAGVSFTDNCPEGLKTFVDHDGVNTVLAGTYPITYRAIDASGNKTEVSANITVKERVYDQATIDQACDQVLASIITPGMSARDQVSAIFNYVKKHVSYLNGSAKHSYLRAAYEGLVEHKGDCYVYCCTTQALLTRAGIPNMQIAKIPARTHHYWNLVDIGDGHGWYHLDTTPRLDHPTIFLWDNTTMMNYSNTHNKSHNYDPNEYPPIL